MTRKKTSDILAHLLARRRINEVQVRAGREFQKHYALAKKEQLIPDGERGSTDGQSSAGKWLTKCYRELGQDGSALVYDVLIGGMTTKQIAEARGKVGPQWQVYYSRRLGECLHALARVYGFSGAKKEVRAVTPAPAPSPP